MKTKTGPLKWPRLLLAAAALLAGCRREAPAPRPTRPLVVFATLYPLADLARQIGGDAVRVDWLLDLGDPIDHYVLTRRERDRMSTADLVLCDSLGRTETWAQAELGRLAGTGVVLSADVLPDANRAPPAGLLCLDPVLAAAYADAVADALARRLPGKADQFRANAKALQARLTALVPATQPAAAVSAAASRVLTTVTTFDPLLARLGVAAVPTDVDVLDLTDAAVETVRRKARQSGLRTALVPFDTPPGALAAFEDRTGVRPVPVDALGYPNFDRHATYDQILAFDAEQIRLATQ